MRTGWPAHYGSDNIIENAGVGFHSLFFGIERFKITKFKRVAPSKAKVDDFVGFIESELAPGGINTLILRVDFNYAYETRLLGLKLIKLKKR